MPSIPITLKKVGYYQWQLFAPKGHAISPTFRGNEFAALDWAKAWVSPWFNWTVVIDKGDHNGAEKDRISRQNV